MFKKKIQFYKKPKNLFFCTMEKPKKTRKSLKNNLIWLKKNPKKPEPPLIISLKLKLCLAKTKKKK